MEAELHGEAGWQSRISGLHGHSHSSRPTRFSSGGRAIRKHEGATTVRDNDAVARAAHN
jgi:hypothetical protein